MDASVPSNVTLGSQDASVSRLGQSNVDNSLRCEWNSCQESFGSAEQLYEHICDRHIGRKSTNNLSLSCQWSSCRVTTVKRDHITSHVRVHVPLKPHKCDFCQKAFKRPQDLKKHVKTHAEDPNYQASPEPNRNHNGAGGPGVFAGAKPSDLQHLAVSAYGYSDSHGMQGTNGSYSGYGNANAQTANSYQNTPNGYQANYMTTLYPVAQGNLATEYEVRKRATFDALNEFFSEYKDKSYDPTLYNAMSRRLLTLSSLPSYTGAPEFSGGTAVATAAHPPSLNHYTLPMPSIRSKTDLHQIDHFLEQLQATVYEHETASAAAAAGVAQPGSHYIPTADVGHRSSISPPRAGMMSSGSVLAPMTSTSMETPALTPDSSSMSYHSPQSSHSSTISPVSRPSVPLYPTLPSSLAENVGYSSHGSASALTSTHDPNANLSRRYHTGDLRRGQPANTAELPEKIKSLGINSPTLSHVDPALTEGDKSDKESPSASIDPNLERESSPGSKSEESDWIVIVRVLEAMRTIVQERLEKSAYADSDDEDGDKTPKAESEADNDQKILYPVIRAMQEAGSDDE